VAESSYRFDESYREPVTLRDGAEVVLRMIRSDDKDLLRAGFHRLSEQSRYLRFHGVKTELTDAELRYLTEVDGVHHLAIGAVREVDGAEEGLGIARLVELAGEPGVAEAAITVLDEAQGKGLGRILFKRLVAAAEERGIKTVRCLVLGSNHATQEMLKQLAGPADVKVEAGVVTIDVQLPTTAPRESRLYELLRLAARRVLELRP
jgi:GNAT superfamily N-acetyltransferase